MTLHRAWKTYQNSKFPPFHFFSYCVYARGEKCLYAVGPSKETFSGLFAMLMQLFKTDKKMNGLFETEAPFRTAELISSDNFGI